MAEPIRLKDDFKLAFHGVRLNWVCCLGNPFFEWVSNMNNSSIVTRFKCALVFILLMIGSVGPIPLTSTLGLLIVVFRPLWFKRLVDKVYADKSH